MSQRISESPLAIYQAHLRRKELGYQYSPAAGRPVFFPRLVCPFTGDTKLEWRVSTGCGVVYATTVVNARDKAPYNVALIELDEGFRMMSRVEDIDPAQVKIGQRVRVRFDDVPGQDCPLPVFVVVEEVE